MKHLLSLLLLTLLPLAPASAQNQTGRILFNGGTLSGTVGFERVIAYSSVESQKPRNAGLGPYAGFYTLGFPSRTRVDSILDGSDGSRLAATSGNLTLYKWDEATGWQGMVDETAHFDPHDAAIIFLYDNTEDDFDSGFTALLNSGRVHDSPPSGTDTTLTSSTTRSMWYLSQPYVHPYYDPLAVTADGSGFPFKMTDHIRFWSPGNGEWLRASMADSTSFILQDVSRVQIDTNNDGTTESFRNVFIRSHTPYVAESHSVGTWALDYPRSGVLDQTNPPTLSVRPERKSVGESALELHLYRVSDSGLQTTLLDDDAMLYFYEWATSGFDRYDLTALSPQLGRYAAIALEGDKFGSARMQSVLSRERFPTVPFTTNVRFHARNLTGTFEIAVEQINIPGTWTPYLIDTQKTATTADDDTTSIGAVGSGYRFDYYDEYQPAPGPAPMIVRQDSADAGAVPRFKLLIDNQ